MGREKQELNIWKGAGTKIINMNKVEKHNACVTRCSSLSSSHNNNNTIDANVMRITDDFFNTYSF